MEKGVRTRLFKMLNDGIMTDVTFVVQGTEIKAHSHIICSYEGPLRDLLETKEENIEINDISPQTFRTVLQYLYTDNCDVDPKNIFELLYAAKKFNLKELGDHCTEADLMQLNTTNVGAFTAQALHFDAKENLTKCREYFRSNTSKVIDTEEFLEIPHEALVELCSTSDISCSALDLYAACLRWAMSECKRQDLEKTSENLITVVGDVLRNIKISEISMDDFLEFIVPLKVLSHEEVGKMIVKIQESEGITCGATLWPAFLKVTVKDYRKNYYDDTELYLPRTTRIGELKQMRIFEGGRVSYPADEFSLRYIDNDDDDNDGEDCDGELDDSESLADLGLVGYAEFEIYSIKIAVRAAGEDWEYPLTIKTQDLWERDFNLIKGHAYGLRDIHPDRIRKVEFYNKIPGGIATVFIR